MRWYSRLFAFSIGLALFTVGAAPALLALASVLWWFLGGAPFIDWSEDSRAAFVVGYTVLFGWWVAIIGAAGLSAAFER